MMIARPDSAEWTAAVAVGGRGESQVAKWFKDRGFVVENIGKIDTRRDLLVQAGVEIKTDRVAETSGRVAVEVSYRGHPSGLSISTAGLWCFIIGPMAVAVPTSELRRLVDSPGNRRVQGGDNALSTLVLLPIESLKAARGVMLLNLEGGR